MKLFPRLLLWFLLANVLTAAITVVVGARLWLITYTQADARRDAQVAVSVYEREGPRALNEWLRRQSRETGVRGLLLDEFGSALGRWRGPDSRALRQHLREHGELPDLRFADRVRTVEVSGSDGRAYHWIAFVRPPDEQAARFTGAVAQVLIGALIITAAALLAARLLAAPIRALQRVTGDVAGGNLQPQMPVQLLRRRDELGALSRSLDHMTRRLAQLVQGQRQLLRDISHELRSPLARLRIATELAREQPNAAYLDRIEQETQRLDELIGQVLMLQRMETVDPDLRRERVDLSALLDVVCDDVGFEAAQRQVTIQRGIAAGAMVWGQPTWLRAALENVVRNAARHSTPGSTVSVRLATEDASHVVSVSDAGPGVAPEHLERIFQPFFRADADEAGGFGLGLTIAERAVNGLGGDISAANQPQGGLQVTLRLPAVR
jgi:signal transduction histidine kinase